MSLSPYIEIVLQFVVLPIGIGWMIASLVENNSLRKQVKELQVMVRHPASGVVQANAIAKSKNVPLEKKKA